MKKSSTVTNFGQGGVNTDIAPWMLGESNISDGRNFRTKGDME